MDLLLVIDLQNQFINENTKSSIKDIENLINTNKYSNVVFTRFINSKINPTYTRLNWKGCMDEESTKVCIDTKDYKVINKGTYSSYNEELENYIKGNNIGKIYLCGIDIDCCVLATALDLFDKNYDIYVLKDYVYCMKGENLKNNALDILKRNIGKNYII